MTRRTLGHQEGVELALLLRTTRPWKRRRHLNFFLHASAPRG